MQFIHIITTLHTLNNTALKHSATWFDCVLYSHLSILNIWTASTQRVFSIFEINTTYKNIIIINHISNNCSIESSVVLILWYSYALYWRARACRWAPKIIYFMFSSYLYSDARMCIVVWWWCVVFFCCCSLDSLQNAIPFAQRRWFVVVRSVTHIWNTLARTTIWPS